MKWSWAQATNNRALTTVRERNSQRTLLPDNTPNPGTSKRANGPEQTHKEGQLMAVKGSKPLRVRDMEQCHQNSISQKAAKYPRNRKEEAPGGGEWGVGGKNH